MREQFWVNYPLAELLTDEWEALCDGCALCCLNKLEDEDTGDVAITDLRCRFLLEKDCRCSDYTNRHIIRPDCVELTAERVAEFHWLPDTCAYRRLSEGRKLPYWHYLLSGDKEAVHTLEVSVKHCSISETKVPEDDWQTRVVRWVD